MNAADILKYGHLTVLKTIDGLSDTGWIKTGACGVWSVKDIIAHLASYEHILVEVLNSFLESGPAPYLDQYLSGPLKFNDDQVGARQAATVAETLAEYTDTQAQTMTLVARIPAETLRQPGTLPWYGMEYSLDDFIVYTYYGHKREHCGQIAVFRDTLA